MNELETKANILKENSESKLNLKENSPIEYVEYNLKIVPKTIQTEDLIRFVCSNDGMALKHASKRLITSEICTIAVTQNGLALEYVPERLITSEICTIAVTQNGFALKYVPYDMRTKELAEMAIAHHNGRVLEYVPDGIYKITSEQYRDFNEGRWIEIKGGNYTGTLYVLKRKETCMFVLETTKGLFLMVGGARERLEKNNVQYYYDNMERYKQRMLTAIQPYKKVLEKISHEVRSFGGDGTIHGCIVDISWFSHIYVNPYDGKITPYWALNITSRVAYNDIKGLLKAKEPRLLKRFMIEHKSKSLPLIERHLMTSDNCSELAIVPKWVFGTEMYKLSRIMNLIQYAWEKNVIRVWNEEVLSSRLPQIESSENKKDDILM